MSKKIVYLDHAAATPVDKTVLAAMEPYLITDFYNPSAVYDSARKVRSDIDRARQGVAGLIGAKSSEITFLPGGTEANNTVIKGVMDRYPGANMLISAVEHPSVYIPAANYEHKNVPVNKTGLISVDDVFSLVDDNTALVSIIHASNEIGTIQPIADIGKRIAAVRQDRLVRGINLPLFLHTDACQSANYLDLSVSRLGVDFMTINGGKIYGPKQSGMLFHKKGTQLKPLIEGGGQEDGWRSGTENVAATIGLYESFKITREKAKAEAERLEKLRDYLIEGILSINSRSILSGHPKKRLANNVHFSFPGLDNEELLIKLDARGIMAAAGSACSASSREPSSVLKAIGMSTELARSSIRVTLGRSTTKEDLDYCLMVLKELI